MNKNRVDKIFEELGLLLKELRGTYSGAGITVGNQSIKQVLTSENKKKRGSGPTKPVSDLITQGFFDSPRTLTSLSKEFKKSAQNFDNRLIATTLTRLVRKHLLKRDGDGTSKNPWQYTKA